ncbi:MAG: hypothetical protein ACREOC_04070 [Gemmatimonadales bacterium]
MGSWRCCCRRQIKTARDMRISGNRIHDNNRPNVAAGGTVAAVPAVPKILVVGQTE